jgi:hypothetical protein
MALVFYNREKRNAMDVLNKTKIVPPQEEGTKKDIDYTVKAIDKNDAQKLFVIGRNRLVDVNNWSELCGAASATFRLTDAQGNEVNRTAEKDDLIKIDIPAPGNATGHGYDWVYIEAIEDKSDTEGPTETIAMRVRPTSNPKDKGENIAHFFSEDATSSFIVTRNELEVTAAVYGRNEKPNTDANSLANKIRNAVVATSAIFGIANIQWNNLVKGLIAV